MNANYNNSTLRIYQASAISIQGSLLIKTPQLMAYRDTDICRKRNAFRDRIRKDYI